jgi:NADH:ubiquinone oxidoreductase subunit F (NADH-binding)
VTVPVRAAPPGTGADAPAAVAALPGLPGLPLADRCAGPLPRFLLAPGVLLLAGVQPGRRVALAEHVGRWDGLPHAALDQLVTAAEAVDLVGGGGAAFPTGRKLASLAGRPVSHVVVNAAEGERASGKDGVLLAHVPHLVLDGAVAAARALGAARVVVRISADRPDLAASLPLALAERTDGLPVVVSVGPAGFVAGEASAVVSAIAGGSGLPAELGRPPRLPGRRVGRRPHVLVSNVETFARLALAVRGAPTRSALASVSGAVHRAGVLELPEAATLADLADLAGGMVGSPRVLITGGWHGRWVAWPDAAQATLTRDGLAAIGGRWGAGAFVWVPGDVEPVQALVAVAEELAAGTARQCGPCWRGLPEVARTLAGLASGVVARDALDGLLAEVDGRGICAHPSASVAAIRSGLDLIGAHA